MSFSPSPSFEPAFDELRDFKFGFSFELEVVAGARQFEVDAFGAPEAPPFRFNRGGIEKPRHTRAAPQAALANYQDKSLAEIFAELHGTHSTPLKWDAANALAPVQDNFGIAPSQLFEGSLIACPDSMSNTMDVDSDAEDCFTYPAVDSPSLGLQSDLGEDSVDEYEGYGSDDDDDDEDFAPTPQKVQHRPISALPARARATSRAAPLPDTGTSQISSRALRATLRSAARDPTPEVASPPPSSPASTKRKAAHAPAGPIAKKSAKASARTPRASSPASLRPVEFPTRYQHLLDRGSTRAGARGMLCNFKGCTRRTGNFADMDRHHAKHYREPESRRCPGCAGVFSRKDSCKRHIAAKQKKDKAHFTADRQAFVEVFAALPEIVQMRVKAMEDEEREEEGYTKYAHRIGPLFEKKYLAYAAGKPY
ncbi:hypothetical protein B0H15DRAFT_463514 [Mycena belliarum]|uniref:Uncharacterized protein n=1 Tax=Mycena belliarum TaxID=1033014 RepID=A0AAD6XSX4_9AGAR|nr:hypothetical protein B0H15DRAFT_463514 [Mycena belliae]